MYQMSSAAHEASLRQARQSKLDTIREDGSPKDTAPCTLRRYRRASDHSPSSRYSRMSVSTISSYYEGSLDWDSSEDLYDVSESESDSEGGEGQARKRASSIRLPDRSDRYSEVVIPSPRDWPTIEKFKKLQAVTPTPMSMIPLSPEVLSKLPSLAASSATPSLDGSLSSDQQSKMSAPSTPDTDENPAERVDWDRVKIARTSAGFVHATDPVIEVGMDAVELCNSGVRLPNDALDLLQHICLELDPLIEFEPPALEASHEMQEVAMVQRQPDQKVEDPVSATSEYSISQLSIPSPGGFFSSLDPSSRATWSTDALEIIDLPSSTTAEHFYAAPWNRLSPQITELVIDAEDGDGDTTEGPATARYVPFSPQRPHSDLTGSPQPSPSLPDNDDHPRHLALAELDQQLREAAESTLSRTTQWAAMQSEVLHGLAGKDSPAFEGLTVDTAAVPPPTPEAIVGKQKKAVKFLDTEKANAAAREEAGDSLFYHAFQTLSNESSPTDSFVHRHSRFDAMQALRSSLRHTHIDSLLGHFATVDPPKRSTSRPISMFPGANEDVDDPEVIARQEAIAHRERERQAFEQVAPAMWIVEGMRFLAGGRLLNSPAGDVLARAAPAPPMGCRAPPPATTRVLDLGGQPQCDWAWHCAREYPNVRTYTATCDARAVNLTLRGPRNHRLVHVEKLYQLPFPDGFFDVISARSLHQFLRAVPTSSSSTSTNATPSEESTTNATITRDEYDACLDECMRVLKPGGFLEYFILDAELAQPGPKGEAISVEFAVNLKRSGYDPAPTRAWLRRVRQAGFTGIKRAWMFLPLGAIRAPDSALPETPPPPMLAQERVVSIATSGSETDSSGRHSSESESDERGSRGAVSGRESRASRGTTASSTFLNNSLFGKRPSSQPSTISGRSLSADSRVSADSASTANSTRTASTTATAATTATNASLLFSARTSSLPTRAPSTKLPTGAPSTKRGTVGPLCADFKYEGDRPVEAVQGPVGCAADAAHVSGLVGSCLWERWMLKLQMEMGREVGLLDGVGAVVEEGRSTGAGWRCLSGWARKPLTKVQTSFV